MKKFLVCIPCKVIEPPTEGETTIEARSREFMALHASIAIEVDGLRDHSSRKDALEVVQRVLRDLCKKELGGNDG